MPDEPHLEDDVQFGVTRALIGDLVRHDDETSWYSMDYTFVIDEGEAKLPRAPIR
jgi:catechol 1,2-dioxygenase